MKRSGYWWVSVYLLVVLLPGWGLAQGERFVLGQKLRACEAAWEGQPDLEARRRAVGHLQQSVTLFFGLKLGEAGRAMDEARFALESPAPPTAEKRWAESLYLNLETRLLDPQPGNLAITLSQLYPVEGPMPSQAILRLTLLKDGKVQGKPREFTILAVPQTDILSFNKLSEGDYLLRSEIVRQKEVLATREETISLARNLAGRLDALKRRVEQAKDGGTDGETARAMAALLGSLAGKQTLETNYPAARLLRETEELVAGKPAYGHQRPGQFWLTLALARASVAVRLQAPAQAKGGAPLPLVIAMHGAGGSENLFFDGYGRGAIAQLSERRGWLLVAPRGTSGFTPGRAAEIVEAVDRIYPVDRKRVFVVGHSMGASQAIASVQAAPDLFAGVAALGGGGQVRPDAKIQSLPVYIGVGSEDFALANARRLRDALVNVGVKQVKMQEYPGIEHLVIVQVALGEVFRFFEGNGK